MRSLQQIGLKDYKSHRNQMQSTPNLKDSSLFSARLRVNSSRNSSIDRVADILSVEPSSLPSLPKIRVRPNFLSKVNSTASLDYANKYGTIIRTISETRSEKPIFGNQRMSVIASTTAKNYVRKKKPHEITNRLHNLQQFIMKMDVEKANEINDWGMSMDGSEMQYSSRVQSQTMKKPQIRRQEQQRQQCATTVKKERPKIKKEIQTNIEISTLLRQLTQKQIQPDNNSSLSASVSSKERTPSPPELLLPKRLVTPPKTTIPSPQLTRKIVVVQKQEPILKKVQLFKQSNEKSQNGILYVNFKRTKILLDFRNHPIEPDTKLPADATRVITAMAHGKQYALKVVPVGKSYEDKEVIKQRRFEFTVIQTVQHPFIVNITQNFAGQNEFIRRLNHIIVSEWVFPGKTLAQELKPSKPLLPEAEILRIFTQVALAVEQIHSQDQVHANISSCHIYFDKDCVKLGSQANVAVNQRLQSYQGDWYYLAPDLAKKAGNYKLYGQKDDIFALGMLLLEMLIRQKKHVKEKDLKSGEYHKLVHFQYSQPIHKLLDQMLHLDFDKRENINTILLQPILVHEINKLEASAWFNTQLYQVFLSRYDFGWARESDAKMFQPKNAKQKFFDPTSQQNYSQQYFHRLKTKGLNSRMAQFKIDHKRNHTKSGIVAVFDTIVKSIQAEVTLLHMVKEAGILQDQIRDIENELAVNYEVCILNLRNILNVRKPSGVIIRQQVSLAELEARYSKDPKNVKAIADLAQKLLDDSPQFERIETLLLEALNLPASPRIYELLARFNLQTNNCEEALYYSSVVEDIQTSKQLCLDGRAHKYLNEIQKSVNSFALALELDPDNYEASLLLGNLLLEYDYDELASRFYQNAGRIKYDSVEAFFGTIIILKRRIKDPQIIIRYLKKQLSADPHNFEFLTQLGLFRFLQYEDAKAYNLLTRALEVNSFYAPALITAAKLYLNTGQIDQAKNFYARALEINPQLTMAIKGLIETSLQLRQVDYLILNYTSVKRLISNDLSEDLDLEQLPEDFKTRLGILFLECGQHEKAYEILMFALNLDSELEECQHYLSKLALIKSELGAHDEALSIFKEILRVNRECTEAKDAVIGQACLEREMGKRWNARGILIDLLQMDCHYSKTKNEIIKLGLSYTNTAVPEKGFEVCMEALTVDEEYGQVRDDLEKLGVVQQGQHEVAYTLFMDFFSESQDFETAMRELTSLTLLFKESLQIQSIDEIFKLERKQKVYHVNRFAKLGVIYNEAGHREQACKIFMGALSRDSNCTQALTEMEKLGSMYRVSENREKAHQILHYLLSFNSEKGKEEMVKLGVFYRETEQLEKSYQTFMDVLRVDKGYSSAKDKLTKLGVIYRDLGRLDRALEIFIDVVSIDKGHVKVKGELTKIGVLYKELEEPLKAVKIFLALLQVDPDDSKVKQELSSIEIDYINNPSLCDQASTVFIQVLKVDRDFVKAKEDLCQLGIYYRDDKQHEKVFEVFMNILEVDSGNAVAKFELSNLAVIYNRQNENDKACNIFLTLLKVDHEGAKDQLIEKAMFYRLMKNYDRASEILMEVYRHDTGYFRVKQELLKLSEKLREIQQLPKAYKIIKDIIRFDTDFDTERAQFKNICRLYHASARRSKFPALLKTEVDPVSSLFQIGIIYRLMNRLEGAYDIFQEVLKQDPFHQGSITELTKLATLHRLSGLQDRAEEIITEALRIGGKNDETHIEMTKLGLLEREHGDIPKPIQLFIDTLKIKSEYTEALEGGLIPHLALWKPNQGASVYKQLAKMLQQNNFFKKAKDQLLKLVNLYCELGQYDRCLDMYQDLLEVDIEYDKIKHEFLKIGILQRNREQYETAYKVFMNILNVDCNYVKAKSELCQIGMFYTENEKQEQAYKIFHSILKLDQNYPKVKLCLIKLGIFTCDVLSQRERAVKIIMEVLNIDPHFKIAKNELIRIANLYREAEQYEKTLLILRDILHLDSSFHRAKSSLVKLSAAYCQAQKLEKAYKILTEVFQFDENFLEAKEELNRLGSLFLENGSYQKASAIFGDVLAVDPGNKLAKEELINIGLQFHKSKMLDKSFDIFKQVLKVDRQSPLIRDKIIEISLISPHERTCEMLIEVLKIDNTFLTAKKELCKIANIFRKVGQRKKGILLLTALLEIDGKCEEVRKEMEKFSMQYVIDLQDEIGVKVPERQVVEWLAQTCRLMQKQNQPITPLTLLLSSHNHLLISSSLHHPHPTTNPITSIGSTFLQLCSSPSTKTQISPLYTSQFKRLLLECLHESPPSLKYLLNNPLINQSRGGEREGKNMEDFEKEYRVVRKGVVRRMVDGKVFAWKNLSLSKEEIQKFHRIEHPNVVNLIDYFYGKTDIAILDMCELVSEQANTWLENDKLVPEPFLIQIMTHVMKGMQYLHSIGIYHQHLKPENLYITASGLVKMGGFDLKNHDEDDREKNFYFSPDYYFEKRQIGARSDFWALGCMLHEFATGKVTFECENCDKHTLKSRVLSYFPRRLNGYYSREFRLSVFQMLSKEPDYGYTCTERLGKGSASEFGETGDQGREKRLNCQIPFTHLVEGMYSSFNFEFGRIIGPGQFIPNVNQLKILAPLELNKLRLTSIFHDQAMHSVSFRFGAKFISPKKGTYNDTNPIEVPICEGITSVRFNSVKVDSLNSIKLVSNTQEIDINPQKVKDLRIQKVDLDLGVRIISAKVSVNGQQFISKVAFLLYDTI